MPPPSAVPTAERGAPVIEAPIGIGIPVCSVIQAQLVAKHLADADIDIYIAAGASIDERRRLLHRTLNDGEFARTLVEFLVHQRTGGAASA